MLGILAVIGTALAVGLTNAALVRIVRLAPVLATLATYIVLQGISLLLRETPGGFFRPGVTSTIKTTIGWVPVAFLIVAGLALACEALLRWSRLGLALRAVGSDATRAHRLGAHVTITQVSAYVLCSLFTAAGGIMLASQVAIGDPSVGLNYTLTSITAVVLGGASIFGGRGSFIGALCGAVLIQEIVTSTTFLQIGTEWQYYLPGILILAGAGIYSRTRHLQPSALSTESAPASNLNRSRRTMSDKKIIAVVGATGAQGGGLVRAIMADPDGGFTARALTRDPESEGAKALAALGAEVVAVDIDDEASIRKAFEGAYGAFCVTFFWAHFSPELEQEQAAAMASAAKAAGRRARDLVDARGHARARAARTTTACRR